MARRGTPDGDLNYLSRATMETQVLLDKAGNEVVAVVVALTKVQLQRVMLISKRKVAISLSKVIACYPSIRYLGEGLEHSMLPG